MSLKITEIVLGLANGKALRIDPRSDDVTLVALRAAHLSASLATLAIREALSRPKRTATQDQVPFVRVRAKSASIEWSLADDASARMRMLEHSVGGRIPLVIDANTESVSDDAKLELIESKLADAWGVATPEAIGLALAHVHSRTDTRDASPKELAYKRAHERATQLASQVRSIDDQMTASVVPGWLFVACAIGSLAVLMTAITLFNPELQRYVVPLMIVLLVGGLAAYGWRSMHELKIRDALSQNRAQLRQEREAARSETRDLETTLRRRGADPDEVLSRLADYHAIATGPLILHRETPSRAELTQLREFGRQVIVLVDEDALAGDAFGEIIERPVEL